MSNIQTIGGEETQMPSPLYDFVMHGNESWKAVADPVACTTLNALRMAYRQHSQRPHRAWTGDHHAIELAGYVVARVNLCATCQRPAKKNSCGPHYCSQKRKTVLIVKGLRLVPRALSTTNQ